MLPFLLIQVSLNNSTVLYESDSFLNWNVENTLGFDTSIGLDILFNFVK